MRKTDEECAAFLKTLPEPPAGCFLKSLHSIPDPNGPVDHFFTIGPKHIEAAQHFSGILGEAALDYAEEKGWYCAYHTLAGASRRLPRCQVSHRDHKTVLALFIEVPDNKDLNGVPGLVAYLNEIKPATEEFGVAIFAFPQAKGVVHAAE